MTKEQFVDFKIMAEDGVSMDSIGGGGKGGGKGGGGKKGKNKKEVALWDWIWQIVAAKQFCGG